MTFIYRYHHYQAPRERHLETLDAAIADAAGALERGDALPHEIVSDTGDVVMNQRDLLLRIGFSERWISNFIGPRRARRSRQVPRSSEGKAGSVIRTIAHGTPPA